MLLTPGSLVHGQALIRIAVLRKRQLYPALAFLVMDQDTPKALLPLGPSQGYACSLPYNGSGDVATKMKEHHLENRQDI